MRFGIIALMIMAATCSVASAQLRTQPINPTAAVVPTADTTANTVSGGIRGLGRAVAGTLENNAVIRTLNSLLGRTVTTPTQPGFSALPTPSSYQSTRYPNSFQPRAPIMSTYGQNPTTIFPK
jgi:hypothetical protein